jgi:hypothetical protein
MFFLVTRLVVALNRSAFDGAQDERFIGRQKKGWITPAFLILLQQAL